MNDHPQKYLSQRITISKQTLGALGPMDQLVCQALIATGDILLAEDHMDEEYSILVNL